MGKPAVPWPSGSFHSSWEKASKRAIEAGDCSRVLMVMRASTIGLLVRESLSEKANWVESRRASKNLRERFLAIGTVGAKVLT